MTTTKRNIEAVYKSGELHILDLVTTNENGEKVTQCYGKPVSSLINEGYMLLPLEQAVELSRGARERRLVDRTWTEITADDYDEALNVLPPERWQRINGTAIFRMCEYLCGNITAHYVEINGRYFQAFKPAIDDQSQYVEQVAYQLAGE